MVTPRSKSAATLGGGVAGGGARAAAGGARRGGGGGGGGGLFQHLGLELEYKRLEFLDFIGELCDSLFGGSRISADHSGRRLWWRRRGGCRRRGRGGGWAGEC